MYYSSILGKILFKCQVPRSCNSIDTIWYFQQKHLRFKFSHLIIITIELESPKKKRNVQETQIMDIVLIFKRI